MKDLWISDSGTLCQTTTGSGTLVNLGHDVTGALIATIRSGNYHDGTLVIDLLKAEVEDHEIALNLQEAYYSGRPVTFELTWWDTDNTGDTATGTTVVTRASVDRSKPARPRRTVAF